LGPVGTPVTFSGTGWGADATVTITWPRGTACSVMASSRGAFTCGAPYPIPPSAAYTYTFTGNDTLSNTASTGFTVTSSMDDNPYAGPVGTTVTFSGDGFGSGLVATVSWTQGTACSATTDVHGGFNCTYTIPAAAHYDYTFTANDTALPPDSASSNFAVTSALTVSPVSGTVGSQATVTGTGYASSSTLTVTWRAANGASHWFCSTTTNVNGGASCTGAFVEGSYGTGTLTGIDSASNSAGTNFLLLPSLEATPSSGPVGTNVVLSGTGWYPDDSGGVTWGPSGGSACAWGATSAGNFSCAAFSVPPTKAGPATFSANDLSNGYSLTATTTFTVTTTLAVTISAAPVTTDVGVPLTFTATASGGALPYATYTWDFGDGSTLSTSTGSTAHPYLTSLPSGTFTARVTVTDAYGSQASSSMVVTVNPDPLSSVPVPSSPSADVGQTVVFTTTSDQGTGPYGPYAWNGLPVSGCSGTATATVSCTLGFAGPLDISVNVTDAAGVVGVSPTLHFWVDADPSPSLPAATLPAADAGQTVSFWTANSGGSGGTSDAWYGLPSSGCTRFTELVATCSLLVPGTLYLWVNATDSNGVTGMSPVLVFQISPALVVLPPGAAPSSLDVDQSTQISVVTAGGAAPVTLAWNGLPSSCQSENDATIACLPGVAGDYGVTVTATDANGVSVTSAVLRLQVSPGLAPLTVTASRSAMDVGQTVDLSAWASGGSGSYSFGWTGLPTGCSGAGSATLLCAPTAPGTFNVGGWVNDSNGASVSNEAPVTLTVSPALVLGAPTLSSPMVQAGQTVTISAVASGGAAPLTWSWSGLPSGCSASGASFSCSPSATGTFAITAWASDGNGASAASAPAVLTVTAVPPSPSFAQGATGLDWTMLGLLVVVLIVALAALMVAWGARVRTSGYRTPLPAATGPSDEASKEEATAATTKPTSPETSEAEETGASSTPSSSLDWDESEKDESTSTKESPPDLPDVSPKA
jgi:large repetitive protein